MQLHVYKDSAEVSRAAAEWVVNLIQEKLKTQPQFTWLLSGGSTPKQLYSLLAAPEFKDRIEWEKLHLFFGDERVVPFTDDRNNGKMVQKSLLEHVPVPKNQVHFIDTSLPPELSAEEYEGLLHQYFDDKSSSFDLAMLGVGDDGHTLSVFPGSPLVHEKKKWVVSLFLPSQNMHRISLTPVLVNIADSIVFLATGASKASVIKEVMNGDFNPEKYPAQLIRPVIGELHWFMDEVAAELVKEQK